MKKLCRAERADRHRDLVRRVARVNVAAEMRRDRYRAALSRLWQSGDDGKEG